MVDLIHTGIHMLDAPYMMTHTGLVLFLKQACLIHTNVPLAETVVTLFVGISHYLIPSLSNLKVIISSFI